MKIVIAADSFKGCLSSLEVGNAIKRGILRSNPDAEIEVFPISDGGEGLSEALKKYYNTETIEIEVTGPQFNKVKACYGYNPKRKLAVMEMASAAGLPLIRGKKDVKTATTYGVGEMIIDALDRGAAEFIIGIGGSATNDGGIGMLSALGFGFFDASGRKISPNALGLRDLASIDGTGVDERLKKCRFTVACDVDIPLCGDSGCSKIFAPQKGASPEDIIEMDEWLEKYAKLTKQVYSDSDMNVKGAGAAGGLGFALKTYLDASLRPGIDIVISCMGLEEEIKNADYVCTGEGRIDNQTAKGKVVSGIARIAKKYNKPVIAFCGSLEDNTVVEGVDYIYRITPEDMPIDEAMKADVAVTNLERTVEMLYSPDFM